MVIVSVDNLSFGGTGKTSLVIEIGKALQKPGIKFAVVTRGYQSQYEKRGVRVSAHHHVQEVGDEAVILKRHFPDQDIFVGRNRGESINRAIENRNRVVILDDGLQSSDIFKDIKIMLYNPEHPYYYLRNFKFLMKNEDYLLVYHHPRHPGSKDRSPDTTNSASPAVGTYHFELENFRDAGDMVVDPGKARLFGFSALGDNLRFKNDLSSFNLVGFKGYRDHYNFTDKEIESLNRQRIECQADFLVCTEKDFVKLKDLNLGHLPLIYAQNSIKFSLDLTRNILNYAEKKGAD